MMSLLVALHPVFGVGLDVIVVVLIWTTPRTQKHLH
jgi:hypothetical protein